MTGLPTICKCGLAKSYHEGRFSPGHEYVPRYDPESWFEGYRAASRDHDLPGHKAHECRICGEWTERC